MTEYSYLGLLFLDSSFWPHLAIGAAISSPMLSKFGIVGWVLSSLLSFLIIIEAFVA